MSTEVGAIHYTLDLDKKGFDKGLKGASGGLKGFSGKLQALKPQFQKMALVGTIAFAAIAAGVWTATQAAVSAQEIFNKFEVVFEGVGEKAEAVAQDLKKNWGLAGSSAKELLAKVGDLTTGIGFSDEAALDLSEDVVKASIDIASFANIEGGAARVVDIVTKALLGEREGLIALGVKISEADIQTRLLEQGQSDLSGKALLVAKAIATRDLIIERSPKAMGDFIRTSSSAANQQRILAERTKELKETIGIMFIPILEDVLGKIMPVIEKVAEWIEKNPELTRTILIAAGVIAGLVAVIGGIGLVLPSMITGLIAVKGAMAFLLTNPYALILLALSVAVIAVYKEFSALQTELEALKVVSDDLTKLNANLEQKAIEAIARGDERKAIQYRKLIDDNNKQIEEANYLNERYEGVMGILYALYDYWMEKMIDPWKRFFKWVKEEFNIFKNHIEQGVEIVVEFFRGVPGRITNALSGLYSSMTAPFVKAFDKIIEKAKAAWEWIKKINPFGKKSPSLVELVQKGTALMSKEYEAMFSAISDAASSFKMPEMPTTAVPEAIKIEPVEPIRPVQRIININPGMLIATPQEFRTLAEMLEVEFDRIDRAKGAI